MHQNNPNHSSKTHFGLLGLPRGPWVGQKVMVIYRFFMVSSGVSCWFLYDEYSTYKGSPACRQMKTLFTDLQDRHGNGKSGHDCSDSGC